MAWPVAISTRKDDFFKPANSVAQHKTGLKVLIYGKEDTMKTGFALSFPSPVYIFDTELGAPPLFQHFIYCPTCKKNTPHAGGVSTGACAICNDTNGIMKDIRWCDATFLNAQGLHDASVALQSFESAITLLADAKSGTVVIDSGTAVWDWIQEWINEVGKHKEGQLLRFEWAKAKQKWNKLLLQLLAKPLHFVMTAQPQEIYANKEPTGTYRPRVEGATPHAFDIVIHAMRWESTDPKSLTRTIEYRAEITKCRFRKGWRPIFTEITFDKLATQLKQDLGIEVW